MTPQEAKTEAAKYPPAIRCVLPSGRTSRYLDASHLSLIDPKLGSRGGAGERWGIQTGFFVEPQLRPINSNRASNPRALHHLGVEPPRRDYGIGW